MQEEIVEDLLHIGMAGVFGSAIVGLAMLGVAVLSDAILGGGSELPLWIAMISMGVGASIFLPIAAVAAFLRMVFGW